MSTNIYYGTNHTFNELIPVMSSGFMHLGNLLILGLTSLMDMAIEWQRRWNISQLRKVFCIIIILFQDHYLRRLEIDLKASDDEIVFTPFQMKPKPSVFQRNSVDNSQTDNTS